MADDVVSWAAKMSVLVDEFLSVVGIKKGCCVGTYDI